MLNLIKNQEKFRIILQLRHINMLARNYTLSWGFLKLYRLCDALWSFCDWPRYLKKGLRCTLVQSTKKSSQNFSIFEYLYDIINWNWDWGGQNWNPYIIQILVLGTIFYHVFLVCAVHGSIWNVYSSRNINDIKSPNSLLIRKFKKK